MNELGELPALDWTNVTRKLTACVLVCGALIATGVIWDDECVAVGELCLRQWCYALCIAIGAYFLIELGAKVSEAVGSNLPCPAVRCGR